MAEPGGVDDEVRSAAGPQAHAAGELAGPDAGGVDDVARRDAQLMAGELVADDGAVAVERLRGDAGQDPGAVGGGGAGHGDDERGVVGELPVPAHERAAQAGGGERGNEAPGLGRVDAPRVGQPVARGAGEPAHGVAGAQDGHGARRDRAGQSGRQRGQHRQRRDEVRRGAQQDGALLRGLPRDGRMAARQVAQAAVRELRAPAAGALGEIPALDERDAQAARGGVQGDAGAGDAAADDEDVDDTALRELAELTQAPVGGERGAGFETV